MVEPAPGVLGDGIAGRAAAMIRRRAARPSGRDVALVLPPAACGPPSLKAASSWPYSKDRLLCSAVAAGGIEPSAPSSLKLLAACSFGRAVAMGWRRRGKRGSMSHLLQPSMVPLDLASLLFPSPSLPFRRGLCAPDLSLAELDAGPVGGSIRTLLPSVASIDGALESLPI